MGMEIPMEVGSDNITGFPMGPLEISCHWKYNGVVEIQWGKGTPMGYGNSNGRSLVGPRQGVPVYNGIILLTVWAEMKRRRKKSPQLSAIDTDNIITFLTETNSNSHHISYIDKL